MKIRILALLTLVAFTTLFYSCKKSSDDGGNTGPTEYVSPYKLDSLFTFTDLGADFGQRDLLNPSTMDTNQWNNPNAPEYGGDTAVQTWGPPPEGFGSEEGYPHNLRWQQQRVLYVAQRYIKTYFQHHYLLQWKPAANWPWDKRDSVTYGKQGPGTDAPNFVAWVYNYALGIHLSPQIDTQYVKLVVNGYGEVPFLNIKVIQKPTTYDSLLSVLEPGDLLYFSEGTGLLQPYHVGIWVGKTDSKSTDYLILDCYDRRVVDSKGGIVPAGVWIRPFTQGSYYYSSFLKAHRICQTVY